MNRRRFLATLGLLPAARRWRRLDIEPLDEILPARYPYLQNVQADKATIMWKGPPAAFSTRSMALTSALRLRKEVSSAGPKRVCLRPCFNIRRI